MGGSVEEASLWVDDLEDPVIIIDRLHVEVVIIGEMENSPVVCSTLEVKPRDAAGGVLFHLSEGIPDLGPRFSTLGFRAFCKTVTGGSICGSS